MLDLDGLVVFSSLCVGGRAFQTDGPNLEKATISSIHILTWRVVAMIRVSRESLRRVKYSYLTSKILPDLIINKYM